MSVHLTVGVHARTGIDFATWLIDELREEVEWRRAFPLFFQDEFTSTDELKQDTTKQLDRLAESLSKTLQDRTIYKRWKQFCIAQDRSPRIFRLPEQFSGESSQLDENTVLVRPAYQRAFIEASGEVVEISVWGKQIRCKRAFEQLVRFLFSATEYELRSIHANFASVPKVKINNLVACFLRERILEIKERGQGLQRAERG
jgi:hypothetical protein